MGAGWKTLLVVSAAALAACQNDEQPEQNFAIDTNVPAGADIEALPADESSTTPSDELANGAADPAVNDLGNETNAL